jgi:hypothetical protein
MLSSGGGDSGYLRVPPTASLNTAAGLKTTELRAGILMIVFVLGFMARRAFLFRFANVPK